MPHQPIHSYVYLDILCFALQSLQGKLCGAQREAEEGRERERELEMKLEDKTEQVRIVEKKSNGLVRVQQCTVQPVCVCVQYIHAHDCMMELGLARNYVYL